jgi:glutamine synthetase
MAPSVMEVESWIAEDKVELVSMQFTDVMGIVKNVAIPKSQLKDALTYGVWFDGSSIEGFARVCLMNGVDELGFLLQQAPAIERYEAARTY